MPGITDLTDFEIKVDGTALAIENGQGGAGDHRGLQHPPAQHVHDHLSRPGPRPGRRDALSTSARRSRSAWRASSRTSATSRELTLDADLQGRDHRAGTRIPEHRRHTLVVRAYDKSHRLHRGKKTRIFAQQTDSGIASTIAGEAGLTPRWMPPPSPMTMCCRTTRPTWSSCAPGPSASATRSTRTMGTCTSRRATWTQSGTAPELTWGTNLLSFRPRMTAVQQHDKASAYGWDPKTKAVITSTVTAPSSTPIRAGITAHGRRLRPRASSAARPRPTSPTMPVSSVDEAKAIAQALEDGINSEYVQAEGACLGNPAVMAGTLVDIKEVGTKFSGKYFVTRGPAPLESPAACTRPASSSAAGSRTPWPRWFSPGGDGDGQRAGRGRRRGHQPERPRRLWPRQGQVPLAAQEQRRRDREHLVPHRLAHGRRPSAACTSCPRSTTRSW